MENRASGQDLKFVRVISYKGGPLQENQKDEEFDTFHISVTLSHYLAIVKYLYLNSFLILAK